MNPGPTTPPDPAEPTVPAATAEVHVTSPTGEAGTVDAPDLADVLKAGYHVATPDEEAKAASEEKYGGVLGGLEATGTGLVNGVGVGLADPVLARIPGYKEMAAGAKEAHPLISLTAQVAGGLAPSFLAGPEAEAPGAAGLLAQVAKYTPAAAVSELGGAVSAGLGGGLVGAVARGGAESVLYGVGNEISENAIQDKPFAAEAVLANAGADALLGGVIGGALEGALGLSRRMLPKIADAVTDATDRVGEWASGKVPNTPQEIASLAGHVQAGVDGMNAVEKAATEDAVPTRLGQYLGQSDTNGSAIERAVDEMAAPFSKQVIDTNPSEKALFSAVQNAEDATQDFKRSAFKAKTAAIASALPSDTIDPVLGAKTKADSLAQLTKMRDAIGDALVPGGAKSEVLNLVDEARAKIAGSSVQGPDGKFVAVPSEIQSSADRHAALDSLKKEIDDRLYKLSINRADVDYPHWKDMDAQRRGLRTFLEDPQTWGSAGQIQHDFNAGAADHFNSRKGWGRIFLGKAENTADEASKVVKTAKVGKWIDHMASGDASFGDDAKAFRVYGEDTAKWVKHVADSGMLTDPAHAAQATKLLGHLDQVNTAARDAIEAANAAKVAKSSRLGFVPSDARNVNRVLGPLRENISSATNDAERMAALHEAFTELGTSKRIGEGEKAVKDRIQSMLSDPTLFHQAAGKWAEGQRLRQAFGESAAMVDHLLFRSPVEGSAEIGQQINAGKVKSYVGAAAAKNPTQVAEAIQGYQKASRDYLAWLQREVYDQVPGKAATEQAGRVLDKMEAQRARAIDAKTIDVNDGQPPNSFASMGSMFKKVAGGGVALGLAHMGIPGAVPIWAVGSALLNPTNTLRTVATISGHAAELSSRIADITREIASGETPKVAKAVGPVIGRVFGSLNLGTLPAANEKPHEMASRVQGDVAKLATTPAASMPILERHAPQMAALIQAQRQRVLDYLGSQMPKSPLPPLAFGGTDRLRPSEAASTSYARTVRGASDPMSTLSDLRDGRYSPEGVAAMKSVWPSLYSQAVSSLMSSLVESGRPLPSDRQIQLSMFTGQPMSHSMALFQQIQTDPPPPEPQPQGGSPKKSSSKSLKLADSKGTNLQQAMAGS